MPVITGYTNYLWNKKEYRWIYLNMGKKILMNLIKARP
jgi:hypothetical protein